MNIQIVHDYDDVICPDPGDRWFVAPGSLFAALTDGCSEPHYAQDAPPFIYPGGLTGSQMVSKIVHDTFALALPTQSLENLVLSANEEIWQTQKQNRGSAVSRDDAGTLANASFSCLKLEERSNRAQVIWGADVFTIWKTKSGKVQIAGGDNAQPDFERERIYRDLVEGAKDKNAARKEYFLKVFPGLKRKQDNVLYAVLNGQPSVSERWNVLFLPNDLELIILLSDGAWIPIEKWGDNAQMAEEFVRHFEKSGLNKALEWVRVLQKQGIANARIARPEATALAIHFVN